MCTYFKIDDCADFFFSFSELFPKLCLCIKKMDMYACTVQCTVYTRCTHTSAHIFHTRHNASCHRADGCRRHRYSNITNGNVHDMTVVDKLLSPPTANHICIAFRLYSFLSFSPANTTVANALLLLKFY